jgi:hypothetical protein
MRIGRKDFAIVGAGTATQQQLIVIHDHIAIKAITPRCRTFCIWTNSMNMLRSIDNSPIPDAALPVRFLYESKLAD